MDSQSPPNEVVQNISVAGKLAGLTGAGASYYIIRLFFTIISSISLGSISVT